jgi:rod shape-determining protein MreD
VTSAPSIVGRALVILLALLALHLPLVPVGHEPVRAALPDLLFCVMAAAVARNPAAAPLPLVLAFGLAADVLFGRPLGLGALGLVLATEVLRARGRGRGGFLGEWLVVAVLFAAALAGMAFLLALALAGGPGLEPLARHWLATTLAYPLIAALLHLVLRLCAPRTAPEAAR